MITHLQKFAHYWEVVFVLLYVSINNLKEVLIMDKKSVLKLTGSILICQSAGIIGSLATGEKALTWYNSLNRPEFSPPNWLFAPVWIILYLLMGVSLFMVLKTENCSEKKQALIIFGIQLFLNALWSPVFFGLKSLMGGFFVIVLLLVFVFITFYKFYKISKVASYLLIPYIFWVSFASGLNLSVWLLNS